MQGATERFLEQAREMACAAEAGGAWISGERRRPRRDLFPAAMLDALQDVRRSEEEDLDGDEQPASTSGIRAEAATLLWLLERSPVRHRLVNIDRLAHRISLAGLNAHADRVVTSRPRPVTWREEVLMRVEGRDSTLGLSRDDRSARMNDAQIASGPRHVFALVVDGDAGSMSQRALRDLPVGALVSGIGRELADARIESARLEPDPESEVLLTGRSEPA